MSLVPSNRDDDRQLAAALRANAAEAMTQLLESHGGKVQGYLKRRFPSFDETEVYDVLVDAMLRFRETFDATKSSAGGWLLLLAHQHAVDRLRKRSLPSVSLEWDGTIQDERGGSPAARLEQVEREAWLDAALQRLSRLERAVIEADVAAGRPVEAERLAEDQGTTPRSIYAARTRARNKLLEAWQRASAD